MRLELQEHFETLGRQMHGLEKEARRASQQKSGGEDLVNSGQHFIASPSLPGPSVNVTGPPNTSLPPKGETSKKPGGAQRVTSSNSGGSTPKKEVTFLIPESSLNNMSEEAESFSPYPHPFDQEEEDDDDKFFDAPEASDSYLAPPTGTTHSLSHKRTSSSVSVNEPMIPPLTALPENLPASNPDSRIQVGTYNKLCMHANESYK